MNYIPTTNLLLMRCKKSDNKEYEQLDPIRPIFDTNSINHNKLVKLKANEQNSKYKYNQPKNKSLFAQNKLRIHSSNNQLINSISNMPRTRAAKSTQTEARVTFSDNSLSKTTLATNTSSITATTPSTSVMNTVEYLRLKDTIH